MDAILGVWLTSILGAGAFSAAGYVAGHLNKPAPARPAQAAIAVVPAKPKKKKKKPEDPASGPHLTATAATATAEAVTPVAPSIVDATPAPESQSKIKTVFPPPVETEPDLPDSDDPETEDRPTLMPDMAAHEAMIESSVATIPPSPRTPSMSVGNRDHDATRAMIHDALAQVEHAADQTRSLEIVNGELSRQVELARSELRNEVILRAAAEARAEELSDRLARASEEASSMRHRVNMLDRQTKLLRESLKGRGPVNDPRRRDEEAEEMRLRLRDVVDKLERASMPPPPTGAPNSRGPTMPPDSIPRSALATAGVPRSLVPIHDDTAILREEIARLAQENRALRQQALGSLPPRKPTTRDSAPEIDLDLYRLVIERLTSIAGLKGAILADDVGGLLLGSGDLAENLAAFGAYIRDAGARTDRLLPLEGVEEIDIRDSNGMLLSTRVVLHDPTELSLVMLASADASMVAAKKVIDETLWLKR